MPNQEVQMGSTEADGLLRLMNAHHAQNRDDIEALKQGQAHLATEMSNLGGQISGATVVLKVLGWIIGLGMTGLAIWFGTLEARGKMSKIDPSVVSSTQNPPQDATTHAH